MVEVGLQLHPDKTKIVYCKDDNRRGAHEHTPFMFLGYTFRTRSARNKHGRMFAAFLPAVSRVRETERQVRPDYAVSIGGAVGGYAEVKASGASAVALIGSPRAGLGRPRRNAHLARSAASDPRRALYVALAMLRGRGRSWRP